MSARVDTALKEAHERLKTTFGQAVPAVAYEGRIPASTGAEVVTAVSEERLRSLNDDLLARARRLHRQREARQAARPTAGGARRGRDRLGPGRGARLREPARRGHPGASDRPGHRARHLLAPPPRPARRRERPGLRADPEPRRRDRVLRDPQLAAFGGGLPRLRIRLLGRRPRGARRLGGAVRRLRQRRAGGRRPVHRLGALEVGPDLTADAAAPARLRRERPRALERAARAVPAAGGTGEHPDRQLHDRRRSTSTCCGARRSTRARGRSS